MKNREKYRDEHYDNIKFAVEMYMRANRDEIGTIE